MRRLRTFVRPFALIALTAWLGAGVVHVHPDRAEAGGDGHVQRETGNARGGHAAHAPALACEVQHAELTRHDATHEHDTLPARALAVCPTCRGLDDQSFALAPARPACATSDEPRVRRPPEPDRLLAEGGTERPPARGPPASVTTVIA